MEIREQQAALVSVGGGGTVISEPQKKAQSSLSEAAQCDDYSGNSRQRRKHSPTAIRAACT